MANRSSSATPSFPVLGGIQADLLGELKPQKGRPEKHSGAVDQGRQERGEVDQAVVPAFQG
jgi:hypothetical protein